MSEQIMKRKFSMAFVLSIIASVTLIVSPSLVWFREEVEVFGQSFGDLSVKGSELGELAELASWAGVTIFSRGEYAIILGACALVLIVACLFVLSKLKLMASLVGIIAVISLGVGLEPTLKLVGEGTMPGEGVYLLFVGSVVLLIGAFRLPLSVRVEASVKEVAPPVTQTSEATQAIGAPESAALRQQVSVVPESSAKITTPQHLGPKEVALRSREFIAAFLQEQQIQSYLANLEELKRNGTVTEQSYATTRTDYDERLKAIQKRIVDIKAPLNNELELRRHDLTACRTELENLKTRFGVGELSVKEYGARDREIRRRLVSVEDEISQLEALLVAKSSADVSRGAFKDEQTRADALVLTTQSKRGRTLKILGILVCAVCTIAAILFVPCQIFGTNYGWHFILENTGLGTRAYGFIDMTIFILELVIINLVGMALITLSFRLKQR